MDINTVDESTAQITVTAQMGKDNQFNLRIVCGNQNHAGHCSKGRSDSSSRIITNRNVLKVWIAA